MCKTIVYAINLDKILCDSGHKTYLCADVSVCSVNTISFFIHRRVLPYYSKVAINKKNTSSAIYPILLFAKNKTRLN